MYGMRCGYDIIELQENISREEHLYMRYTSYLYLRDISKNLDVWKIDLVGPFQGLTFNEICYWFSSKDSLSNHRLS